MIPIKFQGIQKGISVSYTINLQLEVVEGINITPNPATSLPPFELVDGNKQQISLASGSLFNDSNGNSMTVKVSSGKGVIFDSTHTGFEHEIELQKTPIGFVLVKIYSLTKNVIVVQFKKTGSESMYLATAKCEGYSELSASKITCVIIQETSLSSINQLGTEIEFVRSPHGLLQYDGDEKNDYNYPIAAFHSKLSETDTAGLDKTYNMILLIDSDLKFT
jgi:hypothetical protein